ncbi:transposase, partial [Proteus mirabilis]|uniref:transposase n=1 Tax=Proteus mirabilis TaxID=584 RepID=UPI001EEAEACE
LDDNHFLVFADFAGDFVKGVFPDIAQRYYYKGVLWSPSYFAGSCGGAPISIIRQYIEQQETPS